MARTKQTARRSLERRVILIDAAGNVTARSIRYWRHAGWDDAIRNALGAVSAAPLIDCQKPGADWHVFMVEQTGVPRNASAASKLAALGLPLRRIDDIQGRVLLVQTLDDREEFDRVEAILTAKQTLLPSDVEDGEPPRKKKRVLEE